VIDDENIERAGGRFPFQPELLLQRGEDRGATGIRARWHLISRPLKLIIKVAGETVRSSTTRLTVSDKPEAKLEMVRTRPVERPGREPFARCGDAMGSAPIGGPSYITVAWTANSITRCC
jgi:hypothetical protein